MKFSLTALLDFLTKDIIKEDYGNQNFRHTQRERERERETNFARDSTLRILYLLKMNLRC